MGPISRELYPACAASRHFKRNFIRHFPAKNVIAISYSKNAFVELTHISVQESDDLSARARVGRAEVFGVRAEGDALFDRPEHRCEEVVVRLDVLEGVGRTLRLRLVVRTPQERDDLTSGADVVRRERVLARSGGDSLFNSPKNRFVEIIIIGYIFCKGVFC